MDDFGGYHCHYLRKPPHESIVNPQLSSGLLVFSGFSLGGGGDLESPCPVCWSLLCEPVVGGPADSNDRNPGRVFGSFLLQHRRKWDSEDVSRWVFVLNYPPGKVTYYPSFKTLPSRWFSEIPVWWDIVIVPFLGDLGWTEGPFFCHESMSYGWWLKSCTTWDV